VNLRTRLQRMEQAVAPPGCSGCRDRRGRTVMVRARRLPDGTTTQPDELPAACALCGIIPEFIIVIVEPIVTSADEEQAGASLLSGEYL
jgi:hypothetical protein